MPSFRFGCRVALSLFLAVGFTATTGVAQASATGNVAAREGSVGDAKLLVVPATAERIAARNPADATPPVPRDHEFAVPEAETLLIVGGALLLVALAKRRVRLATVAR